MEALCQLSYSPKSESPHVTNRQDVTQIPLGEKPDTEDRTRANSRWRPVALMGVRIGSPRHIRSAR